MQIYKVTKQYARGPETIFAEFKEFADAELFIEKVKLPADIALRVKIIYRIFENIDLIKEYDPSKISPGATDSSAAAGGKTSTTSFRPTPFATTPRPGGTPQKWQKEEDKDKDKDKE